MIKLATSVPILLAGAVTSVAAMLICLFLPFNVLFFFVNLILPFGAMGAGLVAGLGYYVTAVKVNHRPGYPLLAAMLAVTTASWLLYFFLMYLGSGGADTGPFIDWLKEHFTSMRFKMHRSSTGEQTGKFGYGLALLQLVGYLAPVFMYFAILRGKAFCMPCEKFYKQAGRLSKRFKTTDALKSYLVALNSKQAFSYEHCDALAQSLETVKDAELAATLNYTLRQCPGCKSELLSSDAAVKQGKQWAVIKDLSKTYKVPEGSSMLNAFGKQVT
jgi:hypothetical protein